MPRGKDHEKWSLLFDTALETVEEEPREIVEATYELRSLLGLARSTAVVSAVGSSFELGRGIDPGAIAR